MTADGDATQEIPMSPGRVHELRKALAERGFPLRLSTDAGGYICNSAAYSLYRAHREGVIDNGLFIHTPAVLEVEQRVAFAATLANVLLDESKHIA